MTEIIETESSQGKSVHNLTLKSIGVSPVNNHGVAQHSLNAYISAAYVLDIEIEERPPLYDGDTKKESSNK